MNVFLVAVSPVSPAERLALRDFKLANGANANGANAVILHVVKK